MKKFWRKAISRQQSKALAKLDAALTNAKVVEEKGKRPRLEPSGPVALALGECNLSRADVDKDVRRSIARCGIG